MNKFKVKIIPVEGEISNHEIEGDDGPNFKEIYKLINCQMIEITGARYKDKNYDLYIDEEGRLKDGNPINPSATNLFCDWLDHENRVTHIPNIVGDAALVDYDPIKEVENE